MRMAIYNAVHIDANPLFVNQAFSLLSLSTFRRASSKKMQGQDTSITDYRELNDIVKI